MLQTTLIVPGLDDNEPGYWKSWLEKQLPDARRVRLYQAVTPGAKRFEVGQDGGLAKGLPRHPELDDDVVVYAGTTIPGRITIGKGAVIGGGVWLTGSVAAGSIVTQARPKLESQPPQA